MSTDSSLETPVIRTLQIGDEWFEERQGGLGRVYFELSRNLPQLNVEFRGVVIGNGKIARGTGASIHFAAEAKQGLLTRLLRSRKASEDTIRDHSINLVASHFALYTFPLLSQLAKLPLVVHFHGPWAAESELESPAWLKYRIQTAIEKYVYCRAARFIVLSKAFSNELCQRYSVDEDRIRIVPPGVDTARFNCQLSRTEARAHLGWPNDRFIVIAVRRLACRMGLEELLSAVRSILPLRSEILLHIIGTGALRSELEAQVQSLGLSKHVKLIGRVDEAALRLAYRAADVSIVPTLALEGFGMITLESLASGTPVMVTPVGGLPEAVAKLSSNLILESSGKEAIARGLHKALTGQLKLPDELACRKHVEDNFTWPTVAAQIRKVYLEAVA